MCLLSREPDFCVAHNFSFSSFLFFFFVSLSKLTFIMRRGVLLALPEFRARGNHEFSFILASWQLRGANCSNEKLREFRK